MVFFVSLLSLSEIWSDFNIILKLFVIMTVYSWVRNHIENQTLGAIVFFLITFFVAFNMWAFFGGIYIFWMLLMFGVSQILIDFFFIAPMGGKPESPVGSGGDLDKRQKFITAHERNFATQYMRR